MIDSREVGKPLQGETTTIGRRRWRRCVTAAGALVLAASVACSPVTHSRGNLLLAEKIDKIAPGKQTREDIADLLGTPSTTAIFEKKDIWYYIGERTEAVAFFTPNVVERKVFVIRFDDRGMVRDVQHLNTSDAKPVTLVERVTPTKGKELGVLEQIIGNVGRFGNPEDR